MRITVKLRGAKLFPTNRTESGYIQVGDIDFTTFNKLKVHDIVDFNGLLNYFPRNKVVEAKLSGSKYFIIYYREETKIYSYNNLNMKK